MNKLRTLQLTVALVLAFAGSSALMWSQQSAADSKIIIPWMQAAEKGKAEAQYIMGNAYASGMPNLKIKKNPKTAFGWYLKAAKQNHNKAQYEVAAAYILGDGVTVNIDSARNWLKRAAAGGHKDAKEVLAGFPKPVTVASKTPEPKKVTPLRKPAVPVPPKASTGGYEIAGIRIDPQEIIAGIRIDPQEIIDSILNVDLFSTYWPWWVGGLALGSITFVFWLVIRATLGISSSYDRILGWRDDREIAKAAAIMQKAPGDALESAMMAATLEQFGDDIPDDLVVDAGGAAVAVAPMQTPSIRVPWPAHVTFLLATIVGGFLASSSMGTFEIRFDMGDTFESFFGGALMWPVLLVGGIFVGFGTRMSGGCTSGHGLSGCSRLQPGSLLGTASFFGTAIAVSLLMEMFI